MVTYIVTSTDNNSLYTVGVYRYDNIIVTGSGAIASMIRCNQQQNHRYAFFSVVVGFQDITKAVCYIAVSRQQYAIV